MPPALSSALAIVTPSAFSSVTLVGNSVFILYVFDAVTTIFAVVSVPAFAFAGASTAIAPSSGWRRRRLLSPADSPAPVSMGAPVVAGAPFAPGTAIFSFGLFAESVSSGFSLVPADFEQAVARRRAARARRDMGS